MSKFVDPGMSGRKLRAWGREWIKSIHIDGKPAAGQIAASYEPPDDDEAAVNEISLGDDFRCKHHLVEAMPEGGDVSSEGEEVCGEENDDGELCTLHAGHDGPHD